MILQKERVLRFAKFGVVGGSGVLVDLLTFTILAYFLRGSVDRVVIDSILPIIAYELAVINNFLFSYFWVWKDRKRGILAAFLKYNVSTLLAFGVRYLLFHGGLALFRVSAETQFVPYLSIYAFSIGIGMALNFVIIEFKVFRKNE